jgi:hypothetical protein
MKLEEIFEPWIKTAVFMQMYKMDPLLSTLFFNAQVVDGYIRLVQIDN